MNRHSVSAMFRGLIVALALARVTTAADVSTPTAADYRHELRDLHVLRSYRAMKNSFVLNLEETADLPPEIGEGGRKTILDARGQGSLRHIWETHAHDRVPFELELYVDGEAEPSLRGRLDDLIHAAARCEAAEGRNVASIIPNRSHNWYLPVPFEESLRIDLVCRESTLGLVFLQLDYRLEDDSLAGVRLRQTGTGGDLQLAYEGGTPYPPRSPQPRTITKSFEFQGNRTITLAGPAIIRKLALNKARRGVYLRMRFDDEPTYAVSVDLADFFGPFRGTAFNNNACYLPMPFARSAQLELVGADPSDEWRIELAIEKIDAFGDDWGYMHAVSNHAAEPTDGAAPYDVLYTRGRGKWLGMSLYETGMEHGGGDFAIIDGETDHPAMLHGVNGEDYYSFAFFATGSNHPYTETFSTAAGRTRLHLENPYPFEQSLHVAWGTLRNLHPRSVSFWYQATPADRTLPQQRAWGLRWQVFGQRILHDVTPPRPQGAALVRALLDALPTPAELDANVPMTIRHCFFGTHEGIASGWAAQRAVGPHLNLMYIYRHWLDLGGHSHMGAYPRAMLARTTLTSAAQQVVTLEFTHDDPFELLLNGDTLHGEYEPRVGFTTRRLPATLRAGSNTLLVRLIDTPNNNTAWAGFSLRVLAADGREISRVLQPDHPMKTNE